MADLRDGNLRLQEGERLSFPVEAGDPLSEVQAVREVRELEDVQDAFVAELQRALEDRPKARRGTPSVFSGGLPSAGDRVNTAAAAPPIR